MWTELLIYFLEPASTIPPPVQHNTRAASTSGRLFLTAGGPGSLERSTGSRQILYFYSFSILCSSGEDARIDTLQNCSIQSPLMSTILDGCVGRMYAVSISDSALLQFLQKSKRDSERLAALHCALLCVRSTADLEMKVGKEPSVSSFSE